MGWYQKAKSPSGAVCWTFCPPMCWSLHAASASGRRWSAGPSRCWIAGRRTARVFAPVCAAVRSRHLGGARRRHAVRRCENRRPDPLQSRRCPHRDAADQRHRAVRQAERSRIMSPGEVDVVQADRPSCWTSRGLLAVRDQAAARREPVGRAISPTAARFVRSLRAICSIRTSCPTKPAIGHGPGHAGTAVRALAGTAALAPDPGPLRHGAGHHARDHVRAVVGPRTGAGQLGVSVRTLARAFARHGTTFDRSLWDCRLEAAYEVLLSNRDRASITDLACATDSRIPRTSPGGSRRDLASPRGPCSRVEPFCA